mmetsp:Transcript_3454/g.5755  ORF Transcript_3454/g.5755 Transcript_3454/m.5755 type:complete len:123 (-) Transcript_3454:415-783(-)
MYEAMATTCPRSRVSVDSSDSIVSFSRRASVSFSSVIESISFIVDTDDITSLPSTTAYSSNHILDDDDDDDSDTLCQAFVAADVRKLRKNVAANCCKHLDENVPALEKSHLWQRRRSHDQKD